MALSAQTFVEEILGWAGKMDERTYFAEMLRKVRLGDGEAARQLVEQFEAEIRRIIRVRMTDPHLRRQIDSLDICQSVMSDFFVRVSLGQFEIETPEQLIQLLATMAKNKFLNRVTKLQAERRDVRRLEGIPVDQLPLAGNEETPSQILAHEELLELFHSRLTREERFLADQRAQGRTWRELAEELSEPVDALRKRLTRAINRVSQELGIET